MSGQARAGRVLRGARLGKGATAVAVVGVLLVLATGCGARNASSPSGAEIAYSVVPEDADEAPAGIFLADREGKHHTRLTRVLFPEAEAADAPSGPLWSPTSDVILFASTLGEIWTVHADGSDLKKIAVGEHAQWSPDGKLIAVGGKDEIWTVHADGSDLKKIAVGGGASWSPDGKLIAVGGKRGVQILSADGELQKKTTSKPSPKLEASTPSWSPDGTKIAFTMGSIFVAPVQGEGGAVPVVGPKRHEKNLWQAQWSPDGQLIAFVSENPDQGDVGSIWTARPDGSHRTRVVGPGYLSFRGWAPDGRGVLCTSIADTELRYFLFECPLDRGSWRRLAPDEEKRLLERDRLSPDGTELVSATYGGAIVVSRADGSHRRVLTNPGPQIQPQWSRDSTHLAFVQGGWVYVIGTDGMGLRRLVAGAGAAWLPGGASLVVQEGVHLSVVTLDGRTRRLAHGWSVADGPWALAPDGATVAYLRSSAKGGYSSSMVTIYVKGIGGRPEHKVLDVRPAIEGEAADVDDLAWSPDGRALFGVWALPGYNRLDDAAYGTLHEVALTGSSRVIARGVVPRSGIAVSPRGGQVAVIGKRGLEVVDLEMGSSRTVVRVDHPTGLSDPQWSPDGTTIAYMSVRLPDVVAGLETVRADGSGRKRVSAPGEEVDSFSWRPRD